MVKFELSDVVNLSSTLCSVKIGGCKWDQYLVNGQKLSHWTQFFVIPVQFQVLRAAKWQLREQLLLLIAEFFDLLGQLPVHPVAFALCTLGFFLVILTKDLGFDRAIRWK